MNTRRSMTVVGALVLCVIFALFLNRPSAGQPAAVPAPAAGRYQMAVKGVDSSGVSTVFVFDAATGQCWYRSTHHNDKTWTDMGTPAR